MTKEQAKHLAEVLKAYAEGKLVSNKVHKLWKREILIRL